MVINRERHSRIRVTEKERNSYSKGKLEFWGKGGQGNIERKLGRDSTVRNTNSTKHRGK